MIIDVLYSVKYTLSQIHYFNNAKCFFFFFSFCSGYMAPEYAMRGYLTDKADVYSFGVVALETVSGKSNTNFRPNEDFFYLLDWVIRIYLNA